ncbi:MAG: hypothetical protein ABSA70_05835 [Terriglobia bacterium]
MTRLTRRDALLGRLLPPSIISAALFFLACGVQGPPLPPRVEQPASVKDLAVAQRGRTLELSFTLPVLATDGERLTKPLEVQVFRTVTPPGRDNPNTPTWASPWLTLPAEDLTRHTEGEKVVLPIALSAEEPQPGSTFVFAVRALTRGFRRRPVESGFSNAVQATVLDVPEPVKDLQVHAAEHALELSWSLPTRTLSGQPVSGPVAYRVFRSRTGKPGSFQVLGESSTASYHDAAFEFERTYFYKVAAVPREAGALAQSEDSAVVEITPRDVFPPAAPQGLSAIYTADAVELVWTASAEPDLASYNVYRREEAGAAQRVNPEPLRTPIFRDTSVKAEHRYAYYVTALDLTNNESVPSEEVPVETR